MQNCKKRRKKEKEGKMKGAGG